MPGKSYGRCKDSLVAGGIAFVQGLQSGGGGRDGIKDNQQSMTVTLPGLPSG